MKNSLFHRLAVAVLCLFTFGTAGANQFEACTSEIKLYEYSYLGACGYEQTDTFTLSSSSYVTWVRIWYDSAQSPSGISATLTGPGVSLSQTTTKGGCYAGWCEGKFLVNDTLPAGTYTVTASAASVCRNPSGASTLVVYGCAASTTGGTSGSNLLVNGDAESVAAASSDVTSFPGWSTDGNVTILQYGVGDYIAPTSPGPSSRGNNFFYGGSVGSAAASQTVSLSFAATSIDSGTASYTLAGWLGGWSSQNDNVTVTATFYDASQRQVGATATIGPVLASERGSATSLLERSTSASVPVGARSALVRMAFSRASGSSNDGYADNLSLILTQGGTTTPSSLTSRADCVFGWGERTYPELFSPSGAVSKALGPYYYRYYSQTNSYLGITTSDAHLIYLGLLSGNALLDLGVLTTWQTQAGCQ
ncbi:MAG: hypothetical protein KGZ83_06505 [Sulfuricella sp.]|nr:hypothetical protein [Sulfuricella sp.]